MILYKYVGFDAGLKILETNNLGFSNLGDFNDPFECTGFGFYDLDVPVAIAMNTFRNNFSRKYATLSLTRSALNPLMWSHYGDSYKGIVIGIDTKIAGFEDGDKFIIPSTRGELRYLKTVPKGVIKINIDDLMSVGDSEKLNWSNNEDLLKHALLYKMQEWAYEEEIRVVKNIYPAKFSYHSPYEKKVVIDEQNWKRIFLGTRPLYTMEIPKEAIVEVYLGKNTYIDQRRKQELIKPIVNHEVETIERLKAICKLKEIKLHSVAMDLGTWVLKSKIISLDLV